MDQYSRFRKTYYAALAGAATTVTALLDGFQTQDLLTFITVWGGVIAVYLFPNDPPAGEAADPEISERG